MVSIGVACASVEGSGEPTASGVVGKASGRDWIGVEGVGGN